MADDAYSKRLKLEQLALGATAKTRATVLARAHKRRNRKTEFSTKPKGTGAVSKLERVWLTLCSERFPFVSQERWWVQIEDTEKGKPTKNAGLVGQLVKMYDEDRVQKYLRWGVEHWSEVAALLPDKPIPAAPSIQVLFTFRETLLPVALGVL